MKIIMRDGPTEGASRQQFVPSFKVQYTYQGKQRTRSSEENLNLHANNVFATLHDAQHHMTKVQDNLFGDKVYINPKNHGIAFLRTGLNQDSIGMLVFSLILILLPLLTILEVISW